MIGSALVLVGVDRLFEAMSGVSFPWGPLLPFALIAVGLLALRARREEVFPIIILACLLALAWLLVRSNGQEFLTGRVFRPQGLPVLPLPNVAIGDLTVDLTARPVFGRSRLNPQQPVKVGVGDLVLRVPAEMAVRIEARSGYGRVDVLGRTDDGFGSIVRYEDPWFSEARHRLTISLAAGVGDVSLER